MSYTKETAKIKQQWEEYNEEFDSSDYMDIETHTSMALKVGYLLDIINSLQKENDGLISSLQSCQFHAEAIIQENYSESMDAHYIVEEVLGILEFVEQTRGEC